MLEALYLKPAEPEWPDLKFRENVWLRYSFHAQFYDHNEIVALHVYAEPWYLLRRTPKGAWVSRHGPSHFLADRAKRFILDFNEDNFSGTPPRRFAYRHPEHAKKSLLRRHSFHKHYHDLASKRIDALDAGAAPDEVQA